MAWKYWMIAATGACAFTMTVGAAQSAPLGSAATDFRSSAAAGTGFERVDYRRTYRNRARRAYGYRVSGYAGPRGYGYPARVSRYAAPRPALGYVAPPVFAYSAPPVSGDVAPPAYLDSLAPVPGPIAPPVLAYSPAPVYGYAAGPGAFAYQAPRPIVRFYRRLTPAIEYANPDLYPAGTPAWWAVRNRQDRGGRPK
jgi:hypothetical protein